MVKRRWKAGKADSKRKPSRSSAVMSIGQAIPCSIAVPISSAAANLPNPTNRFFPFAVAVDCLSFIIGIRLQ